MNRSIVCCLLLVRSLCAQTGLTLPDAIAEARSRHPQLRVSEERVRAAEGLRIQAGLRLNPRLILQSENTRFWSSPRLDYPNDTDNFGYLSQVFEAGGKRDRRVDLANSIVKMNEIERSTVERQIASRVSLAYWTGVAAGTLRDLLRQQVASFDEVVQYHRDRVREGAMAEVDLLRVLLERDRILVGVRSVEQEYTQATIALLREMGRTEFAPVTLSDKLPAVRDLPAPDVDSVLQSRPELLAGRENIERARASLRLQQAMAKLDPEVLFGYKRTAGINTLLGGFQINLPVRNRNQGQIAAAAAEIRVAENEVRATESQIRAEVESAWAAVRSRRELLTETLEPMRLRADEIARISLAAYREGGFDLLRLIDAQRARLEAMSVYYRALSDYQQSVTTLQIVTGAPF